MTKIIFSIPFTGKTPHGDGFTSQIWYEFRAGIFKEYTLKSLINQTDKDFLLWLQFRPQEIDNKTTQNIRNSLNKSKIEYVMTFNGPIMMEDKATWHNKNLIERASKSLKELEPIKEDYVIEVGLDSDDMVHKKFIELLKDSVPKKHGAYYMKRGFVYSIDGKLADWINPESMSIYAITYPTKIFLDAEKHFEHQRGFNTHEQIPKLFDAELLPDGMFCSTIHGTNISTVWGHPFMGKEYFYDDEIQSILKDFKI